LVHPTTRRFTDIRSTGRLAALHLRGGRDSPWIAALERRNRVHRLHDPERFASRRHFILPFHDSTFECIADVVEATLPDAAGPAEALAGLPLWGD
jgi:hypothetical protein